MTLGYKFTGLDMESPFVVNYYFVSILGYFLFKIKMKVLTWQNIYLVL